MYGTLDCTEVGRESLNDERPAKNTLAFRLKKLNNCHNSSTSGRKYLPHHSWQRKHRGREMSRIPKQPLRILDGGRRNRNRCRRRKRSQ